MIRGPLYQLPIIADMVSSPFEFFMQGSRTVGRVDSDWDFYVEHSTEVHDWLRSRGARRGPRTYCDALTVNVLRHRSCGPETPDHQVDVALIKPNCLQLKHQQVEIVKPYLRVGRSKSLVHAVAKATAQALAGVPWNQLA